MSGNRGLNFVVLSLALAVLLMGTAVIIVYPTLSAESDPRLFLPVILNDHSSSGTATTTATMTATATATATVTPTWTVEAGPCPCDADVRNCGDFDTQGQAQACFDHCWALTGRDVHRLDQDGDGVACESLQGVCGVGP